MRVEIDRQRQETVEAVEGLKQGLKKAQEPPAEEASAKPDPLTGLPSRLEGEAAMRLACGQQSHAFAALFVLDRIQAIKSRFGSALGDEVLLLFQKHLMHGLSAGDELFRWGPDSFLSLLLRTESGEQVRRELGRFLTGRLEQTFEIGARSVTLPISSTWTVIPLFESSFNQNLRKLDAFRAAMPG